MSLTETIEAASRQYAVTREQMLRDFAKGLLIDPDGDPATVVSDIQRRVRATWGDNAALVMCSEAGTMTSRCAIDTKAGTDDRSTDRFIQVGPKLVFTVQCG